MPGVPVGGRARVRPALVAVVCAVALVSLDAAGRAVSVPQCSAPNLSLEFPRADAATSHRSWELALRNVGPASCELHGYPGIGLLDGRAALMNVTVVRAPGAPATVVLRPWDRAFFTFGYVVSAPCDHGIFPFGLQVIPPNGTQWLRMYRRFDVCGGTRPTVSAMRARL